MALEHQDVLVVKLWSGRGESFSTTFAEAFCMSMSEVIHAAVMREARSGLLPDALPGIFAIGSRAV